MDTMNVFRISVFLGILTLLTTQTIAQPRLVTTGSEPSFDRPVDATENALIERIKQNNLNWQFGLSFFVMNPQDSLRRALEDIGSPGTGLGFLFDIGYYFDPVPVVIGAQGGAAFFGDNSRTFYPMVGPFRDTLTYESINTHIPLNLYLRVQPNILTWAYPYAEVVGGVTIISSSLVITRKHGEIETSTSEGDGSSLWQYGVGAGVMVKLLDSITLPNELHRLLLDIRCRYMWGGSTRVLSTTINSDQTYQVASRSVPGADNVHASIGLVFQF